MKNYIKLSLISVGTFFLFSCEKEVYDLNVPQPEVDIKIQSQDKLTVTFLNNSTGANSHYWVFGDGSISKEASPTHTYELPGDKKVYYTAFSEGFLKADLDSLEFNLKGGSASAASFMGKYNALVLKKDDGNEYPMEMTVTAGESADEFVIEGPLRLHREMYKEWGYNTDVSTGDKAIVTVKSDGHLEIKEQFMFEIRDAGSYFQIVKVEGFGYYNSETLSFDLHYRMIWYNEDGTHDEVPEEFIDDETIKIARRIN